MKTLRTALAVVLLVLMLLAVAETFGKMYGLTAPEHWGTHPVAAGY